MTIAIPAPMVRIGGSAVNAVAGPAPGLPGVTQVTFTMPAGTKTGASVPLVFQLGAYSSNAATLPVAN